ncbi:MAG: response regulator [Pyrinomonadaceae bacterium MAG19_C2-C3]|nr:response regulator [Pyrinomonadaceae bacterium MAG19_C2-C3]
MSHKILIVDDDPEFHQLVHTVLVRDGFDVVDAFDAFAGLQCLADTSVDLALLDVMMPGMDGLELLARLRVTHPHLPVIMMTAMTTPETVVEALREQACDFLSKPFDIPDLTTAVRAAFQLQPYETAVEVLSARPEWIELRVPCAPSAIEPLERIMSKLKTDLPTDVREGITYAFREMLRNAIEHGGKNDPNKFVEVGYLRTARLCLYRIRDPGEGFSPEALDHAAISNPDDDPMQHERIREARGIRPGGFGILIARNMVDEMIYNERHNEVVLIKYLDDTERPSTN